MKKLLLILLAALLLLALLPSAAFADPPKGDTHLHNWVVTSYKKATCTEEGQKTWKCSLCGQTYTETYKALGHDWDEGTVYMEPTVMYDGVIEYICYSCDLILQESIPALDGDFSYYTESESNDSLDLANIVCDAYYISAELTLFQIL